MINKCDGMHVKETGYIKKVVWPRQFKLNKMAYITTQGIAARRWSLNNCISARLFAYVQLFINSVNASIYAIVIFDICNATCNGDFY